MHSERDTAGSGRGNAERPEATRLEVDDGTIAPTLVEYIGGPYAGRREAVYGRQPPVAVFLGEASGAFGRGVYERSAGSAEDGIVRYEWQKS